MDHAGRLMYGFEMDALVNGSLSELQRLIEDLVRRQFSAGAVAAVEVEPWVFDEVEDLVVRVVLARPFREADREQIVGLIGVLQESLLAVGERRFPVVRYMTKGEALKLRREAARFS